MEQAFLVHTAEYGVRCIEEVENMDRMVSQSLNSETDTGIRHGQSTW